MEASPSVVIAGPDPAIQPTVPLRIRDVILVFAPPRAASPPEK